MRVVGEHWIKYVFPVFVHLLLFSVSMLLFVLAGLSAHHYMWLSHLTFIAALCLFLITHHWFFVLFLSESTTHIVVTNHRVVRLRERLLAHEELLEVSFDKIKTVEADKEGLLQTVLQYGSLNFEGGVCIIPLVPHPSTLARDIQQAMGLK